MPCDSTTHIEGRPLVVLDEMPSFHNQVRACLWGTERVFQKVYENTDYWERETTVLDHLVRTDLYAVPQVRYRSRQQLMALLTAVPGVSLVTVDGVACRQLAQSLSHIHNHQALVPRSQIAAMLRRFQTNITASDQLSNDEKRVSGAAMLRLDHTGWIEETSRRHDLVHGDINVANVLHDTATDHLGVLDFERASVGDGMLDLAKASWRILHHDVGLTETLLGEYCGHVPTEQDWRRFASASIYECLGAVSYFAYEGHRKQYPFKDTAISQLEHLCG